ncbi:MAG: hypothetical protein JNK02_05370 [Planctomycetes bacterium]|nr:hypothetical protein [Planctomycetota bacterium]
MTSLFFAPLLALAAQTDAPVLLEDQILWQRSLADARAIAADEGRPILVAINLDGESASDRIVTERYRDPQFVAWTRRFVCVVGHPFRHVPLDHDVDGRRIECPRLGVVTCGEHVRLEPELYDAYLGGERVSPRHALILPDGTRAFDLFLLFDLRELDAALAAAAASAPPFDPQGPRLPAPRSPDEARAVLAGRRHSWHRSLFEALVRRAPLFADEALAAPGAALDHVRAIRARGDAGSVDALLWILQRERWEPGLADEVAAAALERGFARELARALRGVLVGAGRHPGAYSLGLDRRLLALLARLAGDEPEPRSLLVALAAAAPEADRAVALAALAPDVRAQVAAALAAEGGPVDVEDLVRLGSELASAPLPSSQIPAQAARTLDELVVDLAVAEDALAAAEGDPDAAARFGRAALRLALARLSVSGPGIGLLLQDAELWLGRAALARPADELLALDRARTAHYLTKFDEQARIGGEVLARAAGRAVLAEAARAALERHAAWGSGAATGRAEVARAAAIAFDEVAHEALRWIGDAEGRRAAQLGADPALHAASVARGARALGAAVASPRASDVDVQSLATFLRAHGLARQALATTRAGLERFPASNALRDLLRDLCGAAGRPDVLCATADWLAALDPESAVNRWYAGYAWYLRAEWARRAGRPDGAIADYDAATARFLASVELEPAFSASAGHYLALAERGRGFAHRQAGRRQEAADALVRALAQRPESGEARDGLDRDGLDLVDAVLEWTEEDGESRVNPVAFADALSRAVPGEARWLRALSDTCLREGLRADGRVGRSVPVPETMRASGEPAELREPCAQGDRWLELSIEIAARARAVVDDQDSRRHEAQARSVHAERLLVTERDGEAAKLLIEAAQLLGEPAGPDETWHELARRLRERLGEARPVARPGR